MMAVAWALPMPIEPALVTGDKLEVAFTRNCLVVWARVISTRHFQ